MNIILDTHIFLWALSEPARIAKSKRLAIESLANTIYISSITIAEIMIKASIGKLAVDFDPVKAVESCGFEFLAFRAQDAVRLKEVPFHHKDPFDRMLIAQSRSNQYAILTNDEKFAAYDCDLI